MKLDQGDQPFGGDAEDWPSEGIKIVSLDGRKWTIEPPSDEYSQQAVSMTGENLRIGGEQLAEILRDIWPNR